MLGVATEMQDLHRDPPAFVVNGTGDKPVSLNLFERVHRGADIERPTLTVRRNAARHDEADASARPFGIERCHLLEAVVDLLKTQMHGSHQHTIRQRQRTYGERFEQSGKGSHGPSVLFCNLLHKSSAA